MKISQIVLGCAREFAFDAEHKNIIDIIGTLQSDLQLIGSAIATPKSSATERKMNQVAFDEAKIDELERLIDQYEADLPPLTTFILPGGGKTAAHLHLARTICRRAERETLPLIDSGETGRHCVFLS